MNPLRRLLGVTSVIALLTPAHNAMAQQPAGHMEDVIKKVRVLTVLLEQADDSTGKTQRLAGRLYKRHTASAKREHIADVDVTGKPEPHVECASGEKLEAEARKDLVINRTGPQFCKENLKFVFELLRFGAEGVDFTNPLRYSASGKWGAAATSYSDISFRLRSTTPIAAYIVQDAAIAAGAKALGDDKLDLFVVRDPSQRYRLVFSEEGVQQLKQLQRNKGLKETGMLDTATLRVLREND